MTKRRRPKPTRQQPPPDEDGGSESSPCKRLRVTIDCGSKGQLLVAVPSPIETATVASLLAVVQQRANDSLPIIGLTVAQGGMLCPTDRCLSVLRDNDHLVAVTTKDDTKDAKTKAEVPPIEAKSTVHVMYQLPDAAPQSLGTISTEECSAASLANRIICAVGGPTPMQVDATAAEEKSIESILERDDVKKIATPATPATPETVTLQIKTLGGKMWEMVYQTTDTILSVKKQLDDKHKVGPPHAQRIIFGGTILEDHRTVQDYSLTSASTLFLVLNPNAARSPPKHDVGTETAEPVDEHCDLVKSGCCGRWIHVHCMQEHRTNSDRCPACSALWRPHDPKQSDIPLPRRIWIVGAHVLGNDGKSPIEMEVDMKADSVDTLRRRLLDRVRGHSDALGWVLTFRGRPLLSGKCLGDALGDVSSPVFAVCAAAPTAGQHDPAPIVVKVAAPSPPSSSSSSSSGSGCTLEFTATTTSTTVGELKELIHGKRADIATEVIELRWTATTNAQTRLLLNDDMPLGALNPSETLHLILHVVARSRLWADLWTTQQTHIHPNLDASLTMALLQNSVATTQGVVVHALLRNVAPNYRPSGESGCSSSGFEGVFRLHDAWRPPRVALQTDKGMSCFLSCLFVLSAKMSKETDDLRRRVLGRFRALTDGWVPGVTTLKALFERRMGSVRDVECTALSAAFWRIARMVVPIRMAADNVLFEHARTVWSWIVRSASAADSASEVFVDHTLICPLSGTRICKPVAVATMVATMVVDRDTLVDLVQKRKPGQVVGGIALDTVDFTHVHSHPLTAALLQSVPRTVDSVAILNPPKRAAAADSAQQPSGSAQQPSGSAQQPSGSASCDVKTDMYNGLSWSSLLRETRRESSMVLVSALALSTAPKPSLTYNEEGVIVVFTGRAKDVGASTTLFLPVKGEETTVDAQQLADKLSQLGIDPGDDTQAVSRWPDEAILICVDTSNSMMGDAGLKDDKPGSFTTDDEDDEDDAKGTGGDFISRMFRENAWPRINSFSDMDTKLSEVQRRAVANARTVFESDPSLEDLRAIMALHVDPLVVLKEYCRLVSSQQSMEFFRAVSAARVCFIQMLQSPKKGVKEESRHFNDDEEETPDELLCPILRELMADPVTATDGFTYERIAIEAWLSNHNSSPMTGAAMPKGSLNANKVIKNQITKLKELRAKARKSAVEAEDKAIKSEDGKTSWQVFVKPSAIVGVTTVQTLTVNSDTCISTLKRQLSGRLGVPRGVQTLSYQTKVLENDRTLGDYNIQSDATIQLTARTRAPCASPPKRPRVAVQVLIEFRSASRSPINLMVGHDETIAAFFIRIWRSILERARTWGPSVDDDEKMRPSKFRMSTKLRPSGDGYVRGDAVRAHFGDSTMAQFLTPDPPSIDDSGVIHESTGGSPSMASRQFVSFSLWKEKDARAEARKISRLDAAKHLFHAFMNRSQAYDFPKHVGLLLFGSNVVEECKLTPLYDSFRRHIDQTSTDGDTRLFDALDKGAEIPSIWQTEQAAKRDKATKQALADDAAAQTTTTMPPIPRLRLLVLSDGKDTKSKCNASTVARKLQQGGVVVDAIQLGEDAENDRELRAIVKSTAGLCFVPNSLGECLRICELETVLSVTERRPPEKKPELVNSLWSLLDFGDKWVYPIDSCDGDTAPRRKPVPLLASAVKPLVDALGALDRPSAGKAGAAAVPNPGSDRMKRVMSEMRALAKSPHPAVDVFPCEDDCTFWKLVLEGPASTPYKDGVWLLYLTFPATYPDVAPEVRFVTPIRHCNVSSYGRICHSLLDRNWTADTPLRTVIDVVYGLLLNPDVSDPLDSTLALSFYNSDGSYEAQIMDHVKRHAARPRRAWKQGLQRGLLSEEERACCTVDAKEAKCATDDDDDDDDETSESSDRPSFSAITSTTASNKKKWTTKRAAPKRMPKQKSRWTSK